jgi:site-specific DNA-cytosine methylase
MAQDRGVAISFFFGAGGLDLGAEAAGFKVMAAVESNHDAADTMEKELLPRAHARYPALDLVQIVVRQPFGRFWLVSRLPLRLVRSLETAR